MRIRLFFQVLSKLSKLKVILEIFSLCVLVGCSMLTFPDSRLFAQVTEEDDTVQNQMLIMYIVTIRLEKTMKRYFQFLEVTCMGKLPTLLRQTLQTMKLPIQFLKTLDGA